MNPDNYSPEQKLDIEARVQKAKKLLEELQLQPACIVQAVSTGNDVFGIQPVSFLQDTKYTSPIKKNDL